MRSLPWFLIAVGALILVGGIVAALLQLSALYSGVLDKPLDQPDGFEKQSADQMLKYALLAAPGAVLLIAGKIMLKRQRRRRV